MIIIQVKYLPHTGTLASRMIATTRIKEHKYRAVVSYDYALSSTENRREAAKRICYECLLDLDGLSVESADLGQNTVGFVWTGEL
jgi:hypothetical protein